VTEEQLAPLGLRGVLACQVGVEAKGHKVLLALQVLRAQAVGEQDQLAQQALQDHKAQQELQVPARQVPPVPRGHPARPDLPDQPARG